MTTVGGSLIGDSGNAVAQRGRYLTIEQAAAAYPALTVRLLRRLVQERRIPFSRAGRCIVLSEADIDEYFERNRTVPLRWESTTSGLR